MVIRNPTLGDREMTALSEDPVNHMSSLTTPCDSSSRGSGSLLLAATDTCMHGARIQVSKHTHIHIIQCVSIGQSAKEMVSI